MMSYLKALGILRVVGRQLDPEVKGRWTPAGTFELQSETSADELVEWFVVEYVPAIVLSPWNGGSGFFPKGNTTAAGALAAIGESTDPRLLHYGDVIAETRKLLINLGLTEKPTEEAKLTLIRHLRASWPDEALEWLDAAVVEGPKTVARLPVLGAGGGDGRFDFSSNYMQSLPPVLGLSKKSNPRDLLAGALFDERAELTRTSFAHLDRQDSPVVSATPATAKSVGNPWDLVLAIEGSLVLTASAARRHESGRRPQAVAPFAVRPTAAGFASASEVEASSQEVWLPIWGSFASLKEVIALSREARAQVGRANALSGLDFARASAEMGVARGIDVFERYAILERSGQSNLAVPAGRIEVAPRPAALALETIGRWLSALERSLGEMPESVRFAVGALRRAAFSLAERGGPAEVEAVIIAMGRVESALVRSSAAASRAGLRPPTRLSAKAWVEALDQAAPEVAVAVSMGSLRDPLHMRSAHPAMRDYIHGTQPTKTGHAYPEPGEPRRLRETRRPFDLLAELLARRYSDAGRLVRAEGPAERLANRTDLEQDAGRLLDYKFATPCDLDAARALAGGRLEGDRIFGLLRGLCLLDYDTEKVGMLKPSLPSDPNPTYDLLALAWAGTKKVPLRPRPDWPARLANDDLESVLREAHLRLRLADVEPMPSPEDLLLAQPESAATAGALLLQLTESSRLRLLKLIEAPRDDERASDEDPINPGPGGDDE